MFHCYFQKLDNHLAKENKRSWSANKNWLETLNGIWLETLQGIVVVITLTSAFIIYSGFTQDLFFEVNNQRVIIIH